jgi:hypothetical protein
LSDVHVGNAGVPHAGLPCAAEPTIRLANRRQDRDVRSLAEPEPNRQLFVKFKHLLRKAATRSAETICVIIGEILRAFTPTECANYFRNSRYAHNPKSIML